MHPERPESAPCADCGQPIAAGQLYVPDGPGGPLHVYCGLPERHPWWWWQQTLSQGDWEP